MRVFLGVFAVVGEVVRIEARHGAVVVGGSRGFSLGLAGGGADLVLIVVVGVAPLPRIFSWRLSVKRELGLGQSEQRRGMDVGRARRLLDDLCARVLDARARQNAQA